MKSIVDSYVRLLSGLRYAEGLAPLALRLYLGPIFILAGWKKLISMDDTIAWFANPDWGLGLPLPELLAWSASLTEFVGGILLMAGLATRLVSIPLMITMLVAGMVHRLNGWQAIADPHWLFANDRVHESAVRLERAKEILQEYGNYEWLTESGNFVVLNNGVEFAATYFIMCMALLFIGGGRYASVDYWIARRLRCGRA